MKETTEHRHVPAFQEPDDDEGEPELEPDPTISLAPLPRANVRLLPVEFRDAFGLATPAAADQQNYRTAVLAALQTALDWYEQVVPA